MSNKPLPDPEQLLPLSMPVFHILMCLSDSEAHGYAIIQRVAQMTEGAVKLSTSTLYGALKRMLRDQLIEKSQTRPAPEVDDERRRYYRITPFGRLVADLEARRISRLADLVRTTGFLPDEPTP